MSVQTTLSLPSSSARCLAPTTPPMGPETRVLASSLASVEIVPPWLAMTRRSKAAPLSFVAS